MIKQQSKPYLLCLLIVVTLSSSCVQRKSAKQKIETKYRVSPNLVASATDTLYILPHRERREWLRFFDAKNGYCKLRNDSVLIYAYAGIMTGKSLSIIIARDSFSFKIYEYSCTYDNYYTTIEQRLILNKQRYSVNDTIVGEMYFKSYYVLDSIKNLIDTTIVSGRFAFRVRDENYNENTLRQENNYQEFLSLTRQRPDTLSALSLFNCGLSSLPDEIVLFTNIKSLDLSYNDLSNADMSILTSLKNITSISLDNCHLKAFPDEVLGYSALEELNLYANNISILPPGLSQMKSLKYLQLGGNDIESLPSDIGNLKNLESLSVESTSIKHFPKSITQLTKLKEIYPPDSMDYFPPQLAHCLSDIYSCRGIKNLSEFKDNIPK